MASKAAEARLYVKEAEKCMKTSFFKWKADADGAAAAYTKAAVAFKNANMLPEAKSAYENAAECQLQCNQLFHSAKSFEAAAFVAKDMNDMNECVKLIERASNMYLENGTPDTAVLSIGRAAKMMENVNVDKAVELYCKAAHVHENQSQLRQAADVIRPAPRILVRNQRYDEAVSLLQKEMNYNIEAEIWPIVYRLTSCMVLLHLIREDCVAADKALKHSYTYSEFGQSDDAQLLENLLDAVNEGDEKRTTEVLKNALFTHLDNDFARLARKLASGLPDGLAMGTGQSTQSGPKNSGENGEESDEYPDGLL